MDEKKVRQIIQEEMRKQNARGRFGLQQSNFHSHTGTDGTPQLKADNILPSHDRVVPINEYRSVPLPMTFPVQRIFFGVKRPLIFSV